MNINVDLLNFNNPTLKLLIPSKKIVQTFKRMTGRKRYLNFDE